jgi:hypothetical protein
MCVLRLVAAVLRAQHLPCPDAATRPAAFALAKLLPHSQPIPPTPLPPQQEGGLAFGKMVIGSESKPWDQKHKKRPAKEELLKVAEAKKQQLAEVEGSAEGKVGGGARALVQGSWQPAGVALCGRGGVGRTAGRGRWGAGTGRLQAPTGVGGGAGVEGPAPSALLALDRCVDWPAARVDGRGQQAGP